MPPLRTIRGCGPSPPAEMVLLLLLLGLLSGATACVGNSSFGCLRAKLGKAVWRINAIPEISLTDWMSLVKQNRSWSSGRQDSQPEGLMEIIGDGVDTFLETRSLRFSLPEWMTAEKNKLDIDIVKALVPEKSAFVGRRKGGGGGKKGQGMGMLMMAMMGKMAMMSMGLIKMKAMKALMIGAIALVIAKLQLFKMLTSKGGDSGESHVIVLSGGGHGGGGGGHGGGGGGGGGGHGGGHSSGSVQVVHESYGPPSGGWGGGGGGGDSWGGGGGGGGHGGWSSGGGGGGGGGHGGGGWSSGGGGGGGGWSSGGWGKRAYGADNTYTVSTVSSQSAE